MLYPTFREYKIFIKLIAKTSASDLLTSIVVFSSERDLVGNHLHSLLRSICSLFSHTKTLPLAKIPSPLFATAVAYFFVAIVLPLPLFLSCSLSLSMSSFLASSSISISSALNLLCLHMNKPSSLSPSPFLTRTGYLLRSTKIKMYPRCLFWTSLLSLSGPLQFLNF